MWSSLSKGLVAVGAMTAWFAGCGGSSVQHGTPEEKGHGGTVASGATGGATGTGAGQNGGTGGGSVGVGGGPAPGGKGGGGGKAGKGGAAGKGGTPATAGSTGVAGQPDPSCNCKVDEELHDFSCHSSEVRVPSVFAEPASCEGLDTRAKRQYCDDGSTHYTFIEGEENEYALEVNREGEATYFSAFGYVTPLCELPAEFDNGSVTMGTRAESSCFEECALCNDYDDLPKCLTCERDPNDPETVVLTLAEYCQEEYCPPSVAEARGHLAGVCGGFATKEIVTGCGSITVSQTVGFSEVAYVFDQFDGTLRGVIATDDLPFGLCRASSYRVGSLLDCSEVTSCDFCTRSNTGEGGAGGEAGAAGAGPDSGNPCPPP